MSASLKVPNGDDHVPEGHGLDPGIPRVLSRSPHPYHRWRSGSQDDQDLGRRRSDGVYLPSPSPTPSPYDTGDEDVTSLDQRLARQKLSRTLSDSGTEADDEGFTLLKGLPAPPVRPKKGLRGSRTPLTGAAPSPLITPAYLGDAGRKFSTEFAIARRSTSGAEEKESAEARKKLESFRRRRSAELRRRGFETLLVASIGGLILMGHGVSTALGPGHRAELYILLATISVLVALYPLRLLRQRAINPSALTARWIRIPATFDPAPLLYPVFLPIYVALCFLPSNPDVFLPNLTLSLASLPGRLIPGGGRHSLGYNSLHWLCTLLPLFAASSLTAPPSHGSPPSIRPNHLLTRQTAELLTFLYPLHQALLPVLHYLTTTSLLTAELQLLSVAMINVLLYSTSPQMTILKALLWGGGLSVFLFCGPVLLWVVTLARIPSWRFRQTGVTAKSNTSFLNSSITTANGLTAVFGRSRPHREDSDADEDGPPGLAASNGHGESPKLFGLGIHTGSLQDADDIHSPRIVPYEDASTHHSRNNSNGTSPLSTHSPRRRHTFSVSSLTPSLPPASTTPTRRRHKRRSRSILHSYLSLTAHEALVRQYFYASYIYSAIISIVLGPARIYISRSALASHEPIGWALSYLFGNLPSFRLFIISYNLDHWVPLPPALLIPPNISVSQLSIPFLRDTLIGPASTRLLLSAYDLMVLACGLVLVLSLQHVLEVDTRRKVFHGMMVLILLPTTFVDPVFAAFALSLILVLFLILDLFRASQLPPLSRPLAYFLTPYVDGRDLRGPVVISHIFLLIGCAIPLWLSLAGVGRTGEGAWSGWDVGTRDVSMISGVVCVGMGDAAASLVGRRWGRRKWMWGGGKSLEGSAAFMIAVGVGLGLGKVWLQVGGWDEGGVGAHDRWWATAGKIAVAAAGASATEAVLTGGNDNVVVPVVLWLLGKGLGI